MICIESGPPFAFQFRNRWLDLRSPVRRKRRGMGAASFAYHSAANKTYVSSTLAPPIVIVNIFQLFGGGASSAIKRWMDQLFLFILRKWR